MYVRIRTAFSVMASESLFYFHTQSSSDCELSRLVPVQHGLVLGAFVSAICGFLSLFPTRGLVVVSIYTYTQPFGGGEDWASLDSIANPDSEYYSMSSRRLSSWRQVQPVGDFCCRQARKQRVFSRLALSCLPSLPLRTCCVGHAGVCIVVLDQRPTTAARTSTRGPPCGGRRRLPPAHWSSPLLTDSQPRQLSPQGGAFFFPPSGPRHKLSRGIRWATQQLTRGRGRRGVAFSACHYNMMWLGKKSGQADVAGRVRCGAIQDISHTHTHTRLVPDRSPEIFLCGCDCGTVILPCIWIRRAPVQPPPVVKIKRPPEREEPGGGVYVCALHTIL